MRGAAFLSLREEDSVSSMSEEWTEEEDALSEGRGLTAAGLGPGAAAVLEDASGCGGLTGCGDPRSWAVFRIFSIVASRFCFSSDFFWSPFAVR